MKLAPRLLCLSALFVASACGGSEPEPHDLLTLAKGGIPSGWINSANQTFPRLESPEGWLRLPQSIPPDAWRPAPWPGVYQADLTLPGLGNPPGRSGPHELRSDDRELDAKPFTSNLLDLNQFSDGDFVAIGDELFLVDRKGELVKHALEYVAWIERGAREEGRVHLPGVTCDGALLLPGEQLSMELPSLGEDGAALIFGAAAYGSPRSSAGDPRALSLLIEAGGKVVFEKLLMQGLYCLAEPMRIPLPEFAGGRISFRVDGGAGLALIQNPVLRPLGKSPESAPPRNDLVIFLADTFRADNLALWGGDPNLAPNMNAFAEGAWAYVDAHAPASWTLPSQAALLSGVYSPQIGVIGSKWKIPPHFETLARSLAAAGFRTAAVTDGLFVSERYGMDQGFEVFLESEAHADFQEKTIRRVQSLLDADDGRPLFLFVQSYRAHTPYFASPRAMAEHPELFGEEPVAGDWDFTKLFAEAGNLEAGESLSENLDSLRRLYLGGVADLDHGFGDFLEQLESAGLGSAIVLLTSDHGEAFGEHSGWSHGNNVYEEQVGIPLILHVPGFPAEVRTGPRSLVDVAKTFAEFASSDGSELWVGRSLRSEGAASPVFSFESPAENNGTSPSEFAIYDGHQKVMGSMVGFEISPEPSHAFQLSNDPYELLDEAATGTWPRELIERWRAELDRATLAVAKPSPLTLTEAELAEFKAMGYFGE
jgi:arylsulfatase A-like enzyme